MSDPMISTAENRQVSCDKCGTTVTETKFIGAFAGGTHWKKARHDASCGLPCFGAGVSARVYRSGEFHHSTTQCPRCVGKETP